MVGIPLVDLLMKHLHQVTSTGVSLIGMEMEERIAMKLLFFIWNISKNGIGGVENMKITSLMDMQRESWTWMNGK